MSELVLQEAASLIPFAVARLGRIPTLVHAVQVAVEAVGILFSGVPKADPAASEITACTKLMRMGGNVEVPDNSILVVKVGNDHYPTFDSSVLEHYETKTQGLVDGSGLKAKVFAVNHTIDFQVVCHERVTVTDGSLSITHTPSVVEK